MKKFIFLVERIDVLKNEKPIVRQFVCVAEDENLAKQIHPDGGDIFHRTGENLWVNNRELLKVTKLGKASGELVLQDDNPVICFQIE